MNSLTNKRFGKITVLEPTDKRNRGCIVWRCQCDCGNIVEIEARRLKEGVVTSCGCDKQKKNHDICGQRFNKLIVLRKKNDNPVKNNSLYVCQCDCGNIIEVSRKLLISGDKTSCGCAKASVKRDLTNKRFGMLKVVKYDKYENGFHKWICQCDCGNTVSVRQTNLESGASASCGCVKDPSKILHFIDGTCLERIKSKKVSKSSTTGIRGVYYNKSRGKYIAQITFKGVNHYLGGYDYIQDAEKARKRAEENIFEEFINEQI